MIIAVINTYNDKDHIEKTLQSVKGKVDKIVVVDGAYADFPHDVPYSTDGTLDIAKKYADVLIECPNQKAWHDEMVKRSAYLIGNEGDWYLMIDADELFEGDLEPLRTSKESDYFLPFTYEEDYGREGKQYRLFKHRAGLIYARNHYTLWIGTLNLSDMPKALYEHGRMFHEPQSRTPEREEAKKAYYKIIKARGQT